MNDRTNLNESDSSPRQDRATPTRFASFSGGSWAVVASLLVALLPYAGVLRNDFAYMYDDKAQILDNPYVHSFGHLREALTSSVWSHAGSQALNSYYRPVMTLGFLLCYRVVGPNAFGFHLVSLLLHGAVVLILFLFAARLFRDRVAAFATAGLFALHPIHVEPVAWISAVTDLQVTLFFLLTLTCFLTLSVQQGRPRFGLQAAMGLSFALALLSKEQALTLLLLAVIFELFYREDHRETKWSEKAGRCAVLGLLSVGYVLARVFFLGVFAPTSSMHHLTTAEALASAFALLGQYLTMLVWPRHLMAFYVFHPSSQVFDPHVLAGAATLILCGLLFVALWKHARPASFGIAWLFLTLAPVLNAKWMGPYVLADRYLYLPSVGFCLIAGWAGAAVWRKAARQTHVWRLAAVAGLTTVAALCVLRIETRIPDWQNDVALFSHDLEYEPDQFILHDALGDAFWLQGKESSAEREWKEALRINPGFVRSINALGALYAKEGRYTEAAEFLRRATLLTPNDPAAHLNLGSVYAETGKLDGAEEEFRAAVGLAPMNFGAHNVLGKLYFDSKHLPEAEEQFRQSIACEPNLAAYDHLGYIYATWGDPDRAEKAFRAALAMNPSDSHAHYHLGLIYAAAGRNTKAAAELQAALAADPQNSDILSALEKLRH